MKELFVLKKVYLDPEFKLLSLATSSEFLSGSVENPGNTTTPPAAGDGWLGDDDFDGNEWD